jgi:hypothetical protein
MKIQDVLQSSPLRLPAFKAWADTVWNAGLWHGTKLAELLGQSPGHGKAGDVDCVATADQLLRLAEAEGWILRGKMELTNTRRTLGRGHAGAAYPIDHCWMPNRANPGLWDIVYPDAPADMRAHCAEHYKWPVPVVVAPAPVPASPPVKRRRMIQLPLPFEVTK